MKHRLLWMLAGLWLVMGLQAQAQAPGYLGRRNMLRANVYLFPAFRDFANGGYTVSGQSPAYLYHHEGIGYEHATSRRSMLGLDLDLTRVGRWYTYRQQAGRYVVQAPGFGIHWRTFPFLRRGWIAPLGPYFEVSYRILYVREIFRPAQGGLDRNVSNYACSSLAFMTGYSFPIGDRLMFDFGLRLAFTNYVNYLYNVHVTAVPMYSTDLLKLHFGLGFLLGK